MGLNALDGLRDCDVALEWVRQAGATDAIITKLKLRRGRLWAVAKRRLKPKVLDIGDIPRTNASGPKKLTKRLEARLATITQRAMQTAQRTSNIPIEELHKLRRVVRRWRYFRELQLAPREIRRDRRLKTLIEVQEALGALQNEDVILAQLKLLGRSKTLEQLRRTLQSQFTHHHREALRQIKALPALVHQIS